MQSMYVIKNEIEIMQKKIAECEKLKKPADIFKEKLDALQFQQNVLYSTKFLHRLWKLIFQWD